MSAPEKSSSTAFDPAAPQDERTGALSDLMANHRPIDSEVREMVDFIREDLDQQSMMGKAARDNVVPFPRKQKRSRGMSSVEVDEYQIMINGDYIDRQGPMSFDMMRAMVDQTPVLSSIIWTRIRQVQRFCRAQEGPTGPGFVIRHIDREHKLEPAEHDSIQLLQRFFTNGGWEFNPRRRRQLRRESFSQFMSKLTRDSLTLDSVAIETEFKRDRAMGMDGIYAVDGGTIRLCSEEGYDGDDDIFALQVVQGQIRTAYTLDDLIYEPRNPRSDVLAAGYGLSEVELLVKTVTGYLNALTYNQKFFDSNSIPKGLLHIHGNFGERDLTAFRRYWNGMVRGVNNAWNLPVLVSKDQESKASFEALGGDVDEMLFARWMTFLTAVCCAIYGMDPAEINSDAFSAGPSPLSGDNTAERLAASKDKGLRPLLSYFENLFTDYIVSDFSDKYCFRWTGLDDADEEKRHERAKLTMTVDEMRAEDGREPIGGQLGSAPVNSALIAPWMQIEGIGQQQGEDEDFGTPPGEEGDDAGEDEGEGEGAPDDGDGNDDGGAPGGSDEVAPGGEASGEADEAEGEPVAKSLDFGMPVMKIWDNDAGEEA